MNAQPFDLETLQRWMQSQMAAGGSSEADAAAQLEDVITRSRQQTSRERLDVYCYAYQARLLECLREEFATLCKFLGEDVFDSLAAAYLEAHPSSSYTLTNLGAMFPQFLKDFSRQHDQAFEGTQFLIDLATLERIYAEVFDGPGVEGMPLITADTLRGIDAQTWQSTSLRLVPCLKLVRFEYPVHEFITACRQGTEPPLPEPRPTWLAVTRRQYVVRRISLTAAQFELLTLLMAGRPIGEALADVAASSEDLDAFARDIRQWFENWTAAGFFHELFAPAK